MKFNLILLLTIFSFCYNQKQLSQYFNYNRTIINNPSPVVDTTPVISWQVKGCAERAVKGDTKFPSSGEYKDYPDLPMPGENEILAEGDSVIYSRFVHHGCCRKAEVSTQLQGKIITIVEFWTGKICKCMCNSTIRSVIQKLPKGEYQVYAVETGTNPFDDKPNSGRDTVMHQKVTIK